MSAKLNLEIYSGADQYSDGEIEDELLEIIKSGRDINEVLSSDKRWPILYHLSPIRQNIINWYPFNRNSSCLEIGGGCGAITSSLCESLNEVKVAELSKRRSTINFERNKTQSNLEIIVGNFNDIIFNQKFDYITLIGVLEYAGSFTFSPDPYKNFLKNIKNHLNGKGKLIIAIENRYGLKYFAGAKEDHTGKLFDGITGYLDTDSVRTFGKVELENLLTDSGYPEQQFYYPHPDYKMPMEIYSQDWLPSDVKPLLKAPNFDTERYELFNEGDAFLGIIKNGQYEFFANSFLVICGE